MAIGEIVGALADSAGNVLGQVNQELALHVAQRGLDLQSAAHGSGRH